jgi:hypothetical protein
VPEGSWENIGGHMAKPGTITLPDDRLSSCRQRRPQPEGRRFQDDSAIGESGGNRNGMRMAADKLNEL